MLLWMETRNFKTSFVTKQLHSRLPSTLVMTHEEFRHTVIPLKHKLFRFALHYLANEEDARDVVQDVMLKVWESHSKPGVIKNLEAWCMTICRNKSLDKLKRKDRHQENVEDQFQLRAELPSAAALADRNSMMVRIKRVMKNLPETQREVLVLRDFEGRTYQEIAEILHIDINRVKVSIHRARKSLREHVIHYKENGIH